MKLATLEAKFPSALALLGALVSSAAAGQTEPSSQVHVTVNGVFFLCPKLVRTGSMPDSAELAKLGFAASEPVHPGETSLKSVDSKGLLYLSYNAGEHRCTVDYAGPGYEQISGIVRDVVQRNGLTRINGGDKDGAKADVFEGPAPGTTSKARVIIIENYTSSTSAISYTEKVAQ